MAEGHRAAARHASLTAASTAAGWQLEGLNLSADMNTDVTGSYRVGGRIMRTSVLVSDGDQELSCNRRHNPAWQFAFPERLSRIQKRIRVRGIDAEG